jgi:hypothetical protein
LWVVVGAAQPGQLVVLVAAVAEVIRMSQLGLSQFMQAGVEVEVEVDMQVL